MDVINDVLEFSKLQAESVSTTPLTLFDPRVVVDDVAAMVAASIRQKSLPVKWNVVMDASVPRFVLGDATHLRRVLVSGL